MADRDPARAGPADSDESPDLERLFAAALELEGDERRDFLERSCGADRALRREIEELLAAHDRSAGFFESLAGDIAAAAPLELESAARPTLRIDRYRILEGIGRGGMGAVYRAERVDGELEQQVALKLLHLDMDSPPLRARFLAERQLLADLSHPHIARLLDGGVTDEGRPYFVMELVEGMPITDSCRHRRLGVEAIVRLLLQVIDAVAYLHRHLVVHRDLKPGNILVTGDGSPRLLDFGIAKLLADEGGNRGLTRTGQAVLTPEYAAPEQIASESITTATDVYALGVLLYELLTGQRPYPRVDDQPGTARRELPTRPSTVLKTKLRPPAEEEPASATRLPWRRVSGDLDQICLKALAPEPERRYASAAELGQDLERHLKGVPVRARPATLGYRVERFVRRNRRGVVAAALALVLLGAVLVRERDLRLRADEARVEADREAAKAVAVSDFLSRLLASVRPRQALGRTVTVAEVLDQAAERLEGDHELLGQPAVEASVRLTLGNTYVALGESDTGRSHLERALALRQAGGHTELEVLEAMAALGRSLANERRAAQAEPLLERVLAGRTRLLGEEDPLTLQAMDQLATVLWLQGRLDEVEALDRRNLEIKRRALGPEHPLTLRSLNGLAATLHSRARFAEAAELFAEAHALQRRQLGPEHPDTLMVGNNLASCFTELGRYAEADALHREVLTARLRVLGNEHEDTLMSMHNLGQIRAALGDFEEAASLLEESIAVRERRGGVPLRLLGSKLILADVYRDQQRYGDAERLYRQAMETGADDGAHAEALPLIAAKAAAGLALLRLEQSRIADAEALLDRAVAAQAEQAPEHPDRLFTTTLLARLRRAQGRHQEALEHAESAVVAATAAFGEKHPTTLNALTEQAQALIALGREDEALPLAEAVHRAHRARLGEEHRETERVAELLVSLRSEQARRESGGSSP